MTTNSHAAINIKKGEGVFNNDKDPRAKQPHVAMVLGTYDRYHGRLQPTPRRAAGAIVAFVAKKLNGSSKDSDECVV